MYCSGWDDRCSCSRRFSIVSGRTLSFKNVLASGVASLYMIPGSAASLRRICLGETNLLLIYEDRRARLWDMHSREFWRSISLEKAEELLPQGGWTELYFCCFPNTNLSEHIPGFSTDKTMDTVHRSEWSRTVIRVPILVCSSDKKSTRCV